MFIHFQFSKNSTPPPTESLLPLELLSTSVCGLKTEICHADTISVSSVLVHPISDWPTAGAKSAGAEALGGELTGTLGATTGAGGSGDGRSCGLQEGVGEECLSLKPRQSVHGEDQDAYLMSYGVIERILPGPEM